MTPKQLIIFSDMDGSLLDHETYSHSEADAMLAWLKNKRIPVIPCTSKTRAELEVLRQQIDSRHPFIAENGAAAYVPRNYFSYHDEELAESPGDSGDFQVKQFSQERAYWQALLQQVPTHLNDAFLSFETAGIEGVMQMTGLARDEARRASQREYGEPLKWLGNEQQYQQFRDFIASQQGRLLKGGRFVHLSGTCDKGQALAWLVKKYQQEYDKHTIISIALGDSQNDVAMLEAADYAVVIRSPVHDYPTVSHHQPKHVYYTQAYGPKGWKEGVEHLLNEIAIS